LIADGANVGFRPRRAAKAHPGEVEPPVCKQPVSLPD
jgi:hypothetical protein